MLLSFLVHIAKLHFSKVVPFFTLTAGDECFLLILGLRGIVWKALTRAWVTSSSVGLMPLLKAVSVLEKSLLVPGSGKRSQTSAYFTSDMLFCLEKVWNKKASSYFIKTEVVYFFPQGRF